jgi:hypothetical protein
MCYGYYDFRDGAYFVAPDGGEQAVSYSWPHILSQVDAEAALADAEVPPVAGYAGLVRSLCVEPPPDHPDAHASLAQLALYAASFAGRVARRRHDAFGPYRLTLAAGEAEFEAAANIGVAHWAMERHDAEARAACELADETVPKLTAMMARSLAYVAPLLQSEREGAAR